MRQPVIRLLIILCSWPTIAAGETRSDNLFRVSASVDQAVVKICVEALRDGSLSGPLGVEVSWVATEARRWAVPSPVLVAVKEDHLPSPTVIQIPRQTNDLGSHLTVSFGICVGDDYCVPIDRVVRLSRSQTLGPQCH
jgi:hypothetical protein